MSTFPGRANKAASSVYPSGLISAGSGFRPSIRAASPKVSGLRGSHSDAPMWVPAIALNRLPGIAQSFFVRVAVLGHDGGYAFGSHQRQAKAGGRSVIEYVHRVAFEFECLSEGEDRFAKASNVYL